MPDLYTQQKLAIQQQFIVGMLADYTGQRKALHGTVKIVGHERKGGIIVDVDGVIAVVSPFSLLPVAAVRPRGRGKRPEAPQNGHRPPAGFTPDPGRMPQAKPNRNGIEVVPDRSPGIAPPLPPVAPTPAQATPRPLSAPLGKANIDRFFFTWLRDFRRDTSHAMRQAVINDFDLVAHLRDLLPPQPRLHAYRQTVYYIAAVGLADPSRLPPPAAIPPLLAARFGVAEAAVPVHITWMTTRLHADHARYVAKLQPPTIGVTQ